MGHRPWLKSDIRADVPMRDQTVSVGVYSQVQACGDIW
jgi:hypothetical protein